MAKLSKSKLKPKRTRNPVETRAKLLRATMELVSEKGAAALSLKEAAIRAKVSRGVAYLHFEDREQLLNEARTWIFQGLQDGVMRFDADTTLHDRTFHITKVVLTHPEAAKLMITAAMGDTDLDRAHPLCKLVLKKLKELKEGGQSRPDIDAEIMTYIMFGAIAATIMLGAQRKGDDIDRLAERFANEWDRMMEVGIFAPGMAPTIANPKAAKKSRATNKLAFRR
jgi:AcrR family transcriptional regulator